MKRLWLLLLVWAAPAWGGAAPARLKIAIAASEAVPFIKTGGLADVTAALHRGYAAQGHQSTLFLPRYPQIQTAELEQTGVQVQVPVAGRVETATLLKAGDVYFLDNPSMYSEQAPYAPKGSYDDTDERFIFFSRGVTEAVKKLGLRPDVFHVHDWHAALIPALVEKDEQLRRAATVTTIHNIAYQGTFDRATLEKAGLDPADFRFDRYEYHGRFSLLKAGLVASDGITTVSPTYARQIQDSPEFGMGLEGLLRHRSADVRGIINGIDDALWNPATDAALAARYDRTTVDAGKSLNKTAIQQAGGLQQRRDAPLFAVASRMDRQKGVDLIAEAIPTIVRLGGQVVVVGLGSGDRSLDEQLQEMARRHPGQVFLHPFSEVFARLAFAGADFLLMPSRFEPCGLSQLIAQLYGTLPVGTRTGGLADTIKDAYEHPGDGDGLFLREFSLDAMKDAVARAVALYHAPGQLDAARRTAMSRDRSWDPSVTAYVEYFRELLARKGI